jgi:hypothetical protein
MVEQCASSVGNRVQLAPPAPPAPAVPPPPPAEEAPPLEAHMQLVYMTDQLPFEQEALAPQ